MTNHKRIAAASGRDDAATWMQENPSDSWAAALAPNQLGADEALVNAMGVHWVAKHFGVVGGSAGYYEALEAYNVAWRNAVRDALSKRANTDKPRTP